MTASSATAPGTLYLVATPIGNRDDITARALHTLRTVDTILAEDTRHSAPLLNALGIKKPLQSFHAHNEAEKSATIISSLVQGKSFALISDAGTPLISDPGFPLVKLARAENIPVVPIPGACALITALSAAGVPCDTFTFAGFLPAKQAARRAKLEALSKLEHTMIFYESSHRIQASLEDIAQVFGEACEFVLAKELTKLHERFVSGTIKTVLAWLNADDKHQKGEFVLIIPARALESSHIEQERLLSLLLAELPLKQAVKILSEITGEKKNHLYQKALELQAHLPQNQ